jgi:hypothetical protein
MIIDSHAHWWLGDEYVHSKAAWEMLIKGLKEGNLVSHLEY